MSEQTEPLDYEPSSGDHPVPYANVVLALGISSLVGCFCYGFIGFILGVVALVLAKRGRDAYFQNPQAYNPGSYKNLNAGRVCAIIGTILGSLLILAYVIAFAIIGVDFFDNLPY